MRSRYIILLSAQISIFIATAVPVCAQSYDLQGIGFVGGYSPSTSSEVYAISANGSVIAGGGGNINNRPEAFRWTVGGGIEGLGFIDGGGVSQVSVAQNISSDGTVITGYSSNAAGNREAFRWTASGGMQGLGFIGGGGASKTSMGYAANADGTVVVGSSTNAANFLEAFRWTAGGGIEGLGFIDGGGASPFSIASKVNADGTVVAGYSSNTNGQTEVFRWTASNGMQGLGFIDGGGASPNSSPEGISADGSVVIGNSTNSSGNTEAFWWTEAGGMIGLGSLQTNGFSSYSFAKNLNADGSVVVGEAINSSSRTEAYRWTQNSGMQGLGFIDGGGSSPTSGAINLNSDGSVIIGKSTNASDLTEAFIWTAANGMQSIKDLLTAQGTSIGNWTLNEASFISADGSVIIGNGNNPDGNIEAWIVRITPPVPPVPPPPIPPGPGPGTGPQPPAPGFIVPSEIRTSISDTAAVIRHSSSSIIAALADIRFIALDQCRVDRLGDARLCTFITGSAAVWNGRTDFRNSNYLSGSAGVAVSVSQGTQLGLAFNLGKGRYDLRLDGSNTLTSYGASAFASYSQSGRLGLQLVAATSLLDLDVDITRSYRNGATAISRSKGSTDGHALGAFARIGWGVNLPGRTTLTPFAELEWIRVHHAPYAENGGTFPSRFHGQTMHDNTVKLGSTLRHELTSSVELFGAAALAHRMSGHGSALEGLMVDIFKVSSGKVRLKRNWMEMSAGMSWAVTEKQNLSGSFSAATGHGNRPDFGLRAGYSHAF